jgi:hypothetical protein
VNPTDPPAVPGVTDAAGGGVLLGIILALLLVTALGLAVMAALGVWRYRPLRRNVRFAGLSTLAFYVFFATLTGFAMWTVPLLLLAIGLLLFGFAPKKWSDGMKERMAKVKAARPQRPTPPPAE